MHEHLQQTERIAITAIIGLGGIGKTELALQYAYHHLNLQTYPGGICWLRARDDLGAQIISFVRSLLELTPPDELELVEKVHWCWRRWWEGTVLLIFDDVQHYDDIAPFLPPQDPRFKVLITTRSRFGSPIQEIQLEVLSEGKAIELLQTLVDRNHPDLEGFQNLRGLDTAKQICQWLGYLPLGIELVGRYLARKPNTSLETLWQRLQEKRLDAIAFKQTEPGMTAFLGVAATFELSWQELDESAQQLAAVLSLFALVEIPWTLVEQCLPEMDTEELEEIRDQVLLGANLLKRVDQGMYQLHQLLREFFASKRSQRTDDAELQQQFFQVVIAEAERVIEKPERSFIKESTVMIAHLQAAINLLARPEQALDLATCLHWIAELYYTQGRFWEAKPLYVRTLSIREQQLGTDHPNVASSLNNLAKLYRAQGRYTEAEPLLQHALQLQRSLLGEQHPDVASSLNNLAELYRAQGRYTEAEPLLQHALQLQRSLLGEQHPDVASSLNNLAELYRAQGRYTEAEPLYKRSLAIGVQQLGNDHPVVANSLDNLALLYKSQARYNEAELLYQQALAIKNQQLGSDHPSVAASLNNLAGLYEAQNRYSEAEALYLQTVEASLRALGEDHPDLAINRANLAGLYLKQGRYTEAEPLYLKAINTFQQCLGSEHPYTTGALEGLKNLLTQVVRKGQPEALSDHPLIQELLSQVTNRKETKKRGKKKAVTPEQNPRS